MRGLFQSTQVSGIVSGKNERSRGRGRVLRGRARSTGPHRRGCVGGQPLVAGTARRRAFLVPVTVGAPGHRGEHRFPFSAVTGRARYPGSGMRGVGEDDVPVGFRPSAPGWIGEAVPPRIRGIGGLAMAGGAIRGRCRPGVGGVRTVAGNADAFRDGHVPVVAECPVPRRARNQEKRHQENGGRRAEADSRHPSDRTGESGMRQVRSAPTSPPLS